MRTRLIFSDRRRSPLCVSLIYVSHLSFCWLIWTWLFHDCSSANAFLPNPIPLHQVFIYPSSLQICSLWFVSHNNRGAASCYVTVSYYFIHVICSGLTYRLWSIYLYNSSIYFICIRLLDESVGEVIREIRSSTEKFPVYTTWTKGWTAKFQLTCQWFTQSWFTSGEIVSHCCWCWPMCS
jgi:hypothetical protein